MKKRGFTLIELLAVIVILAIIALIAVPTVINIINKARKSAFKDSAYGLIKAGELYYAENWLDSDDTASETIFEFPNNIGSLPVQGKLPSRGQMKISLDGDIALAISDGKYCAKKGYTDTDVTIDEDLENCSIPVPYEEVNLNGALPEIKEGMIPVVIENDGTVKKADLYSEWYNYTQKKWANVVTVSETTKAKYKEAASGTEIAEGDILTYLVWIPRYKYKLWYTEAADGNGTDIDESKVHSINIVFESKETAKSTGLTNGTYLTHPAFTFGSEELNGIWVGKFETGYAGATSKSAAEVETADSTKVVIKPNTYSWRNINVSNMYTAVKGMNGSGNVFGLITTDTHMMKNTEWGAVAYLSHSKYGKDSEVYINNNNAYMTGCGGDTASEDNSSICHNAYGSKVNGVYNQSTTGNISGIFDMSGGAFEYVMGYMTKVSTKYGSSGFTDETFPESKYVDIYDSATDTQYSKRKLGDATGEMGPFASKRGSWYDNYAGFVYSTFPWFYRGGSYVSTTNAGVFRFSSNAGGANINSSFRVVAI